MIFLKLRLSNFYMFEETELDLTYKKKVKNSTIDFEYLRKFENIKFKRICILSGPNASGKTKLGRMLLAASSFLAGKEVISLESAIRNKNKPASLYLEFVDPSEKHLCIVSVEFDGNGVLRERYMRTVLFKSYSYEELVSRAINSEATFVYDRGNDNKGITAPGFKSVAHGHGFFDFDAGWNYSFAEKGEKFSPHAEFSDLDFMEKFLKIFDNSIKKAEAMKGDSSKDEFRIYFSNGDTVIVSDGEVLADQKRLSRGTLEAIEVSYFSQWLGRNTGSTYYLDEKMAYSHTDMEQAILNLLISKLKPDCQFFYTTHNHDILGMNLPTHSFVFLRKSEFTEIIHPEKMGFTKNDRSLVGYVENDVFGTLPDSDALLELYE